MNNYPCQKINYLRISITDRCNFNCSYCRPQQDIQWLSRQDTLRYEEIEALAKIFVKNGIRRIRITGGEPLVMKDIEFLISRLSKINLLEDLSLTTNGFYLKEKIEALKDAGLKRINVSLNSLNPATFKLISGFDSLDRVLEGIQKAKEIGFKLKLNTVLLKGINDREIIDFITFARKNNMDIRFIEHFSTDKNNHNYNDKCIEFAQTKTIIENALGKLDELPTNGINGPARYFKLASEVIKIGFINSNSEFFCDKCNRLRLSAMGFLYPCLHADYCIDLKTPLRNGNLKEVSQRIRDILDKKFLFNKDTLRREFSMSTIGG